MLHIADNKMALTKISINRGELDISTRKIRVL